MARPTPTDAAGSQQSPESPQVEAAALATKLVTLPSHRKLRAGQLSGHAGLSACFTTLFVLFGWMIYALVWLVTVSLVTVALLRIFYYDSTLFLIRLNAFTRYIYLPAYVCLAYAVWKRRWCLAAMNIAIVSLHLALIAPDFMRDRQFDLAHATTTTATAASSSTVRVFFANVRGYNTQYQPLFEEIKAADPDIIILVEFSWPWHMAYLRSPISTMYPYGDRADKQQAGAVSVFSKLPLKSAKLENVSGRGVRTIEIPLGSEVLRLIGLHSPRPEDSRGDDYKGFWGRMIPQILGDAEQGPLVVVGDFNATQYSAVYAKLTKDRLRSAHEDRGRGYANTWPNGQLKRLPSLIRIDQALLSPEVECLDIHEGQGKGSDHQPLILDVKIRPADYSKLLE